MAVSYAENVTAIKSFGMNYWRCMNPVDSVIEQDLIQFRLSFLLGVLNVIDVTDTKENGVALLKCGADAMIVGGAV